MLPRTLFFRFPTLSSSFLLDNETSFIQEILPWRGAISLGNESREFTIASFVIFETARVLLVDGDFPAWSILVFC